MRDARSRPSWSGAAALAVAVATVVACGGADPLSRRAMDVWTATMEQDPQFAIYSLEIAGRSSSAFARKLLLDGLGSADYRTALEAAKRLAESDDPGPETEAALREVFATKKGALKLWAARALAARGDDEALAWVAGRVGEVSGAAEVAMVVFLGRHGGPETVRPLLDRKLASDSQAVRDEAYTALGLIGQPWATELLLEGLDREHGEGRRQAILALGRTGQASVAMRLSRFVNTRGLALAALEALGNLGDPETLPAARAMLGSDEPLARVYAAAAAWRLGGLDDPESVVGPLAAHDDPRIRVAVARQLAPVADERAGEILRSLADDTDNDVRVAAVRAIGERDDPGRLEVLLERAHDTAYPVATVALDALGRTADATALERLAPLLERDNPYVVISAAAAILEIRHRESPAA